MLSLIRDFFAKGQVLEVTTPILGATGVTDLHIENLFLTHRGRDYFLQTSPEYAMKRLLAAGSGPVYQICPAFRGGEIGPRHNLEFTMLEWYRPGFSLQDLMNEVEALVDALARYFDRSLPAFRCERYKDLFTARYSRDPHKLDLDDLARLVENDGQLEAAHLADKGDPNDYLDLLFSAGIEQGLQEPVFIRDYPASQAVLATVSEDEEGCPVADRFELFIQGVELANGYFEMTDPELLASRFEENNRKRSSRGLPQIPLDTKLLAALRSMPETAGVALGLDRLLMVLTGAESLDHVMAFTDVRL